MKLKPIKIVIEKTGTGYGAYAEDYLAGTTGENMQELKYNMLEAMNLHFEEQGIEVEEEDLIFELDFKQFFEHYKAINLNALAEKIGMNPTLLSQYVKGHKKPSQKQVQKIVKGLNEIGRELAGLSLIYS